MDRLRCIPGGAGRSVRSLVGLALLLGATGCGGGGGSASEEPLLDGSRPPGVPQALQGVGGKVVMTRTRIVTPREVDRRLLAACTRRLAPAALQPGETLVERTGVMGVSLTFRGRPGGWVRGCDATVGLHGPGGRWCGVAIGRVRPGGRLYDPRLDIGCLNAKGRQIGFAWIDPLPEARYVAVDGHHYTEVYERAAGLPVRLTTDDVRVEGSSAAFRLTQYAADGSRLAQETVRTTVAG